jgi:molybdenum transport protein
MSGAGWAPQGGLPQPATYRLMDEEIDRFLREDCPFGDLTTILLEIGAKPGRITFSTRHETTLCCTEEAARLLERQGCAVTLLEPSGSVLPEGRIFLEATGSAESLHTVWKAAVNLLEAASAIATRTRELVRSARSVNPAVEVVATRKIFPGTKAVAIKAVYAGGGLPHRLGLSESVLVFEQHRVFLGGSQELWARLPEIKNRAREKKIGVEVIDEAAALSAALAGADIVQVDKMGPEDLGRLVQTLRATSPGITIAAAGGVTQDNVEAYASTGVDLLVTSSMYWGKPADIAVSMEALG